MADALPSLDQVTVVIVTYNSSHCIADLGRSLKDFVHVVISDNASEDGTAQAVRKDIPQALWLAHEKNLGFGAANNRALVQVTTPYAMLLNPDCEISSAAVLSMLAYMQLDKNAAIVAPQIMRNEGVLELSYRWPRSIWQANGPAAEAPCCVGFVTGAAMLFRLSRFTEIGFFDEDFFLYYEDEDLCLRLFEAKCSIVVLPSVRLKHSSRGSVRGKHPLRAEYARGYHHVQSKIFFARKHGKPDEAHRLMRRTWVTACLGLPVRMLFPVPRLVARWCGRIAGAWAMRKPNPIPIAIKS
jgi:N-acetylglucosaminyl-diphospho-decaprenol L-rhamnosyltransferase